MTDHDRVLSPGMGITTALGFRPTGGGGAAINGDIAMRAHEVQAVIKALRGGGISVVELHSHALHDDPHLLYLHFWADADADADAPTLPRTLRTAVDATHTSA